MSLNCRPGDLAIVVSTLGFKSLERRTLGRIVKVLRPDVPRSPFGFMWEVEHHYIERVADACLRPIRDNDGEDESFRWAPAPEKALA